jgi:hypothetical protein
MGKTQHVPSRRYHGCIQGGSGALTTGNSIRPGSGRDVRAHTTGLALSRSYPSPDNPQNCWLVDERTHEGGDGL